jgi:transcriptional regulator with XRE-family HTH domain
MNVGNMIRVERKAKAKTLCDIADALAISPNTIWQLERLNRTSMVGLERVCAHPKSPTSGFWNTLMALNSK